MKRRTHPLKRSGTSPYQKKAKRPYQYPSWIRTGVVPHDIERTLLGRPSYRSSSRANGLGPDMVAPMSAAHLLNGRVASTGGNFTSEARR